MPSLSTWEEGVAGAPATKDGPHKGGRGAGVMPLPISRLQPHGFCLQAEFTPPLPARQRAASPLGTSTAGCQAYYSCRPKWCRTLPLVDGKSRKQ